MRFRKWRVGRNLPDTPRRTMAALGMNAEEFAARALIPRTRYEAVLAGAAPMSIEMLGCIERAVGQRAPASVHAMLDEYDLCEAELEA